MKGENKIQIMAKVDSTTKRFWNKTIVSFLKYYPVRIKNVGSEQEVARRMVWDFKDGKAHEEVAQMTAKRLKDMFGDKVKDIVFFLCACIIDRKE